MGWSVNKTRVFVKLYLSHNCLWNIEHEDYKHNYKRVEAYRDIIKKFNALTNMKLAETEVRSKIKSLRSTYIQYIQKARRERRSIDSISKSIVWFDDFHKCFSSLSIPRNLYEETASNEDPQEPETDLENSSQKVWLHNDSIEENSDETKDDYILLLKNEPEEEQETRISHKRKHKYKRYNHHEHDSIENLSDQRVKPETTSTEDEFDIYGKYIASQLREMGLQRALRVQLQVQNIISEARLDALNDHNVTNC